MHRLSVPFSLCEIVACAVFLTGISVLFSGCKKDNASHSDDSDTVSTSAGPVSTDDSAAFASTDDSAAFASTDDSDTVSDSAAFTSTDDSDTVSDSAAFAATDDSNTVSDSAAFAATDDSDTVSDSAASASTDDSAEDTAVSVDSETLEVPDTESDTLPDGPHFPQMIEDDTPETLLVLPGYTAVVVGTADGSNEFIVAATHMGIQDLPDSLGNPYPLDWRGMYVARYTAEKHLVWAASAEGDIDTRAITVLSDNSVIAVGDFMYDVLFKDNTAPVSFERAPDGWRESFIAKWDSTGTLQWARRLSSQEHIHITDVDSFENDDFVICGYYNGDVIFGEGESGENVARSVDVDGDPSGGVFTARYDGDGHLIWLRPGYDAYPNMVRRPEATGVVALSDDSSVTAGRYDTRIHFWDGEISEELYIYAATDPFLVKYDSAGMIQEIAYAHTDIAGTTIAGPIASADDDSLIVGGDFNDRVYFGAFEPTETILQPQITFDPDLYIARYDADLAFEWVSPIQGITGDITSIFDRQVHDVATLSTGDALGLGNVPAPYIINPEDSNAKEIGSAPSTSDTLFVARYAEDGGLTGLMSAYSDVMVEGGQIDRMNDNGFIIAGIFESSATFYPDTFAEFTLTNQGQQEVFVYMAPFSAFDNTVPLRVDVPPEEPPPVAYVKFCNTLTLNEKSVNLSISVGFGNAQVILNADSMTCNTPVGTPCIEVESGTDVSVDLYDDEGLHLEGYILDIEPGVDYIYATAVENGRPGLASYTGDCEAIDAYSF
ncbi:MAG: hypothetical protein JXX14_25080 [Deltaproteobacteria bacterium]|nr:hypothetical protein [Deltaproteobacteria bacterium]